METTTHLICPKCRGAMSSYERSGVVIDQCSECRGIFLDRGELERLLDLTGGAVAPAPEPQWQSPPPDRNWRPQQPQQRAWSRHDWDDDSDSHRGRGYGGGHGHGHGHHKPYKKKSILREFLDFG